MRLYLRPKHTLSSWLHVKREYYCVAENQAWPAELPRLSPNGQALCMSEKSISCHVLCHLLFKSNRYCLWHLFAWVRLPCHLATDHSSDRISANQTI